MTHHVTRWKIKVVFAVMSLTGFAPMTYSTPQQIASATAFRGLGIGGPISSINVALGYQIQLVQRNPLFENHQLTITSIGQTFEANAQNDPHYLAFVSNLTDGAVQSVVLGGTLGPTIWQPEATFFSPLPAGNEVDLQGYAISGITMTLDSLEFDPSGLGTYIKYWVTFRVYGEPRPNLVISPAGSSCLISWFPAATNFVLQETTSLAPANWTNSTSGSTNPISIPVTEPAKFYRLLKL